MLDINLNDLAPEHFSEKFTNGNGFCHITKPILAALAQSESTRLLEIRAEYNKWFNSNWTHRIRILVSTKIIDCMQSYFTSLKISNLLWAWTKRDVWCALNWVTLLSEQYDISTFDFQILIYCEDGCDVDTQCHEMLGSTYVVLISKM